MPYRARGYRGVLSKALMTHGGGVSARAFDIAGLPNGRPTSWGCWRRDRVAVRHGRARFGGRGNARASVLPDVDRSSARVRPASRRSEDSDLDLRLGDSTRLWHGATGGQRDMGAADG